MPTTKSKPPHWPANLQYIQTYHYHSSVFPELRLKIWGTGHEQGPTESRSRLVAIRPITDAAHPAQGQRGLFAVKKIPPHTRIIDYMGEVHCDDRPQSNYDLSLYRSPDGISVGIDAQRMGNEARFINDYRGIKPKPNAVFCDRTTASDGMRVAVCSSSTDIKKGEEILVSYGKAWWQAR